MTITLEGVGKRFNKGEWAIRNLSCQFTDKRAYAVTGSNGSGKTTLMRIVSGMMLPTQGSISYESGGREVEAEQCCRYISYAAPYMDLVEELTLLEMLEFHFKFKVLALGLSIPDLMELMCLEKSKNKPIAHFSSGMKQRLKLALALYSKVELSILDEPASNLDAQGIAWYKAQIDRVLGERTLLIASNTPHEYSFSDQVIDLND